MIKGLRTMLVTAVIGMLLSSTLWSQTSSTNIKIATHQGYLVVDSALTILSDVNYSFVIERDTLFLPTKSVAITDHYLTTVDSLATLKLTLSDGTYAFYARSPDLGDLFCWIFANGRWVMWENRQPSFNINR
jgi:hypothetical protein